MKTCRSCKIDKNISEFYRNPSTKDGFQGCCKACDKSYKKQVGKDGLTNQQRSTAKIGADGLTSSQRNAAKIGEDGLTNQQRRNTKIGTDGLTCQQRYDAKIGADGLTNSQRYNSALGADGLTTKQRYNLREKYGLSPEGFNRMKVEQGDACAICERTDKKLGVDHNHTTGKVRALLCPDCNMAIGLLGDSPKRTSNAAEYLAKHEKI